jgi:hypothetical protein
MVKGSKMTTEQRARVREGLTGRTLSELHKKRIGRGVVRTAAVKKAAGVR